MYTYLHVYLTHKEGILNAIWTKTFILIYTSHDIKWYSFINAVSRKISIYVIHSDSLIIYFKLIFYVWINIIFLIISKKNI